MKLFKNYKKLYETEVNNRKVLEEARRELSKDCKKYQEQRNEQIAENTTIKQELQCLKEKYAKVRIELEDTKAYLEQEKQVSSALRKERAILKRKLTNANKYGKEDVFKKREEIKKYTKAISYEELIKLMEQHKAPQKIVINDGIWEHVASNKNEDIWNNGGYATNDNSFFITDFMSDYPEFSKGKTIFIKPNNSKKKEVIK